MRSLLLFIGSVIYPVVMVIISPVLLFAYCLLGFTLLTRYANNKRLNLLTYLNQYRLSALQGLHKKGLGFGAKAVRLH